MHFEGTVNIKATQQEVWNYLTDPTFVSECAPGLQSVEIIVPDKQFKAVAAVGLGSVKVNFETDVEFVELNPPNHAKMKAHGKAPGSAVDILSDMELSAGSDRSTDLNWSAEVIVVGTIASLASRLMGSVTKSITKSFFDCIKGKIEA